MVRSRLRLRPFVALAIAAVAAGITVGVLSSRESPRAPAKAPVAVTEASFRSRPDLTPPLMTVKTRQPAATKGKLLLAPKRRGGQSGPAILDDRGRLQWFHPMRDGVIANDFRVQRYKRKLVLTWWEGKTGDKGYGEGSWVIADQSYREIARVRAGNGLAGDLHDLELTDRGTAFITIYAKVDADLSVVNSDKDGEAMDSVIQEVDVATGEVVWEWRSLDHVALGESHAGPPQTHRFPYDYFHINSIDENADGDLLISARNTWGVYKIDKRSGRVLWRLGGLRSDFALGPGVRFAWQHDARWLPDGTISVFDNQATPKVEDESTAVVIRLDERKRTATVARELKHPDGVLAIAEGNAQALPGGGMFVGWGLARRVSEISRDNELLFDLTMPGDTDTYRAFKQRWVGRPVEPPAFAIEREGERVTAYASWNGATEANRWQLLAGPSADALKPVAGTRRQGFETAIGAQTPGPWFAVRALRGTRVLGTSPAKRG
jgi:hypothetical protein